MRVRSKEVVLEGTSELYLFSSATLHDTVFKTVSCGGRSAKKERQEAEEVEKNQQRRTNDENAATRAANSIIRLRR